MPCRHTHTKGGGQGDTLFLHDQEPRDMAHGRVSKMKARERTTTIASNGELGLDKGTIGCFGAAVLFSVSFLLFCCLAMNCKKCQRGDSARDNAKTSSAWTLTMSLCFRPLPAHSMVPEERKAKGHWRANRIVRMRLFSHVSSIVLINPLLLPTMLVTTCSFFSLGVAFFFSCYTPRFRFSCLSDTPCL